MSIATLKEYAAGSLVKYDNLELNAHKMETDFAEAFPYWVKSLRLYEPELPVNDIGKPVLNLVHTRLQHLDFSSLYEEEVMLLLPPSLETLKIQFMVFPPEISFSSETLKSLSLFGSDLSRTKHLTLGKNITGLDLALAKLPEEIVIESLGGLEKIRFGRADTQKVQKFTVKGAKLNPETLKNLRQKLPKAFAEK